MRLYEFAMEPPFTSSASWIAELEVRVDHRVADRNVVAKLLRQAELCLLSSAVSRTS